MRSILIIFTLLLVGLAAKLPDTKSITEKFKKVNENYQSLSQCIMEFEYKVFSGESTVAMESSKCIVSKFSGNDFYQKMEGITVLQEKDMKLIVDDSNHVMLIAPATPMSGFQQIDAEKSLKMASEVIVLKDDAEESKFKMVFAGKLKYEFKAIEMTIDNKSLLLKELVVFYHPKPEFSANGNTLLPGRMHMTLKSFKKGTALQSSGTKISDYLKRGSNGKWIPASKFNSYQLIDQTK